jgi:hypothetical protein
MGWPRCAVCGGDVRRVSYEYRERGGRGEHVFVARCHGAREQAVVTERDVLLAASLDSFRFTTAFAAAKTA